MGISTTPNCLFCDDPETIEHVYVECPNAVSLWHDTENWVKGLNYPHFKISENENIFGEKHNDHLKHIIIIIVRHRKLDFGLNLFFSYIVFFSIDSRSQGYPL